MIKLRGFMFLFLISLAIFLSAGQEDYCRICRDHTLCLYPNENPACPVVSNRLTENQKNEILGIHNWLRRLVAAGIERRGNPGPQPPAKSMPDMTWDIELANIAQRWANQCKLLENDRCRKVQRFQVGQNIASITSATIPAPVLTRLIITWYNEVVSFDSRQVENVRSFDRVEHYTQMLWATSTKLGCGYINYQQGNIKTVTLVCNYGPMGKQVGGKLYEIRR